jgi:hypothetical protein
MRGNALDAAPVFADINRAQINSVKSTIAMASNHGVPCVGQDQWCHLCVKWAALTRIIGKLFR